MAFLRDQSLYCINITNTSPFISKSDYSAVCITTATVGLLGASIQIRTWRKFLGITEQRKRPSPNPQIVFCLALSDLCACLGVIAMSILFLVCHPPRDCQYGNQHLTCPASHWEVYVGAPIEVFTEFFYLATFMWTLMYALDVFFQVHKIYCHSVVYHVVSWSFSVLFINIIDYVTFIAKFYHFKGSWFPCIPQRGKTIRYFMSYTPVLLVALLLPIFYTVTAHKVKVNLTLFGRYTNNERKLVQGVRRKFFFLGSVFLLCWLPNIIDFFWQVFGDLDEDDGYSRRVLWFVEAFFNPLQGFFNCIVYGQHKKLRVVAPLTASAKRRYPKGSTNYSKSASPMSVATSSNSGVPNLDAQITSPLPEHDVESTEESPLLGSLRVGSYLRDDRFIAKLLGEST